MKAKLATMAALAILLFTQCKKETVTPILDEKTAFLEKAQQFVKTATPAADFGQLDWGKAIAYKKDSAYKMVRVPLWGNTQPGQKAVYLSYNNGRFSGNYFELSNNTVTTLSLDNVRKCVAPVTGNGQPRDYTVYENGQQLQDVTGMAANPRPPMYLYGDFNLYYAMNMLGLGQGYVGGDVSGQTGTVSYLEAPLDGSGGGGGGITNFSISVAELAGQLNLYYEQALWLEQHQTRATEMHFFLNQTQYSDLNSLDKQRLALAHLHNMMTDADYLEMVDSYTTSNMLGHPWMLELFKELATEIGLKVLNKYIPGYGDWQSIKDAINDAGHGNWLSALGEVLNIVKKKVPLLAILDAIVDVFDFGKLANKAWKAFDKLKDLPINAFSSTLNTIKEKCGGLLGKLVHDNTLGSNSKQAFLQYTTDPVAARAFFDEMANKIGVSLHTFTASNGMTGAYFDLPGGFTVKFIPTSSGQNTQTGIEFPTIEFLKNNVTIYKFRFIN